MPFDDDLGGRTGRTDWADTVTAPGAGCNTVWKHCRDAAQSTVAGSPGDERVTATGPGRSVGDLPRYVRAALTGTVSAVLGGIVASEYIGTALFSLLVPFLVGVLCAGATRRAGQTDGRGTLGRRIRGMGVGYAVLGVAVGFKVVPGGSSAFRPALEVVPTYLSAALGAVLESIPAKRGRDPNS